MSRVLEDLSLGFTPLTDKQEHTIKGPTDKWSDELALKIACQDFSKAESYRLQNQDWRWRNADELYLGWVQQKYWEGTKIPRASIGVFTAFQQVEALLPRLLSAIFGDNPWFQAEPGAGTTAQTARAFAELIQGQLDDTRVREIIRRVLKSACIYGNGIMELSWVSQEVETMKNSIKWQPKTALMDRPMVGSLQRHTGDYTRIVSNSKEKTIENRPILSYVSIKDFFIDPNCFSPQPQDGQYCATRAYKPVSWFESLRDNKEFTIPSTEELIDLATYKPSAQADATKSTVELMRGGWWSPQMDQTVDPAGKRIEVIAYWRNDRVVWTLDRTKVMYNKPNPYGFMPFYSSFYADVPDRFYAQGICDVVEGEQRLQTSILNGRLDELSLMLHPPVQKKRGLVIPSYQLRSRPGQMIDVDEPGKDYIVTEFNNITQNAYIEVSASEQRTARTTGESDIAVLGQPSSGGNSANRTAAGIGAQTQAAGSRIQYQVENLEDTFIEPMLNDIVKLNQMYPPVGTPMAQQIALGKVRLFMRASAKMQSRSSLIQTLPLILQSITNPAFMQQLAQSGQTVDFPELFTMILDMTGYQKQADLIRPLTPEEKKQLGAPPPEAVLKEKMQQTKLQAQAGMNRDKLSTQTAIEQMKLGSHDKAALLKFHGALAQTLLGSAVDHVLAPEEKTTSA